MIKPAIHIIGLGVSENPELSSTATKVLESADIVIGSQRQLKTIEQKTQARHLVLPRLTELKACIDKFLENNKNIKIAVLASGDPLFYGIGRWFTQQFSAEQLHFYPGVSSIQTVCHKQGIALQDVTVLSLHGRPIEKLRSQLKCKSFLVVLTDQDSNPQALAKECTAAGFQQSLITVHENLGYASETSRCFSVHDLLLADDLNFSPLHVSVIETKGEGGVLPEFPGIADEHYITGEKHGNGMISKREVRLAILSLLQPCNNDVIWDIGAGCGGVSIELAYWNERVTVHAVECSQQRLVYLQKNQLRFGVVSNLHIVEGKAPKILQTLPAANKVFIGGSDGELENLLNLVWGKLPDNGLLVASAVIKNSQQILKAFAQGLSETQVETVELAVKRGRLDHGQLLYEKKRPVEIYKFSKKNNAINIGVTR